MMTATNKCYSYLRAAAIRINVHPAGDPFQWEGGRGGGSGLKPIEEPVTPVRSGAQAWTLDCSESVWSGGGGGSARERRKAMGRSTALFSQTGEGRQEGGGPLGTTKWRRR
jgi:hypothetical protein